jgi:hypothetical protein
MSDIKADQGAVTIESPRPWRRSRSKIGSGLVERTTCQLLVRYSLEVPPVFNLSVSMRTALVREFGYALVGSLEKLRWKLPMFVEQPRDPASPGWTRGVLRRLRSTLAVRLLLPRFQVRAESRAGTDGWFDLYSPGFEASRRIFDLREGGGRVSLLICHVFAERDDDAADRLLNEFAAIAARGVEVKPGLADGDSQLQLRCAPSARIGARRYWEIIIASPERFPAVVDAPSSPDGSPTREFVQSGLADVHVIDDDPSMAHGINVKMPDAQFLRGAIGRSSLDWSFVTGEISEAVVQGEALDEQFIQALARRRLEYARREFPEEEPGATFESSLEIARNAVALHELSPEGFGEG